MLPKRAIKRCPAIKLAVNRTANAIGRIIFLVNSIIIIKGISSDGVPDGTKCANIVLVNDIQKYLVIDIQIGIDNVSENERCAEQQKL